MKHRVSIVAAVVFVGILCPQLFAQTNDEGLANLQFNFVNPGARSLAMGGAFIAMADDATTALANPSGLVNLIKPEVSFEFSSDSYKNTIPWTSGSQRAQASGGYLFSYSPQDFPSSASAISFASFVYPIVPHKIVVSGFFDEETNFERQFRTLGLTLFKVDGGDSGVYWYPTKNTLSMTVRNIGASIGVQPAEKVSVGATLAYSKLQIDSSTQRIDRYTSAVANVETLNGDSAKLSLGLGARVEVSKQAAVGFVYMRRPKFDVNSRFLDYLHAGTGITVPQTFKAPDSFGFGASVRPNESLSVNVDVQRVLYSQLMDGYYNTFYPGFENATWGKSYFEVPDGTEFRLGAEYVIVLSEHPVALRAGYWREPFHSMVHTIDDSAMRDNLVDLDLDPFHSRSYMENTNHISFGGGIALERFALDLAYDYSKTHKRFVVSTVVYF